MQPLPAILRQGEVARLIPVVSDSRKEQRVISSVLAVISAVEEFGKGMLKAVGAPVGKTSKIQCFTEVAFKQQPGNEKYRPDGLVIVQTGGRVWTALVEAKIGKAALEAPQIEAYLDIARAVGADAVITLSNQFATVATHHPVSVNRNKLRSVSLFHWSWTFLLTEARLYEVTSGIADPDQAYILGEMIRYLEHDSSGVASYDRMPSTWKDICASVQQGTKLSRSQNGVEESIAAWHELTRFLALDMSAVLERAVTVHLSRAHKISSEKRLQDDATQLVSDAVLSADFEVPNAASRIHIVADLARRILAISMTLLAPKDKKRPSALCTWIYKQIQECPNREILVVAKWPGRIPDTAATLGEMHENRNALLDQNVGQMPTAFEVRQVSDLGGRFRGARTFVEDARKSLPIFYENVGQRLQAWVPKPPQIRVPSDDYEGVAESDS